MKPLLFDVRSLLKNSIHIKEIKADHLSDQLHFHNAYEIAYIIKGHGRRIVGDSVDTFSDGDLTVMAPYLPHATYSEAKYQRNGNGDLVHAIVVYFQPDWFAEAHLNSPDFADFKSLLNQLERGLKIRGKIYKRIVDLLLRLNESEGMESFVLLFTILLEISNSNENINLSSPRYSNTNDEKSIKKIDEVYKYVMEHFNEKISLDEVASVAHMTPPSFCKYFKSKTNKTFTYFVNEIRIGYACELLMNENLDISQICFMCGFNNFPSFNKNFRQFTQTTPSEYRARILKHR